MIRKWKLVLAALVGATLGWAIAEAYAHTMDCQEDGTTLRDCFLDPTDGSFNEHSAEAHL